MNPLVVAAVLMKGMAAAVEGAAPTRAGNFYVRRPLPLSRGEACEA